MYRLFLMLALTTALTAREEEPGPPPQQQQPEKDSLALVLGQFYRLRVARIRDLGLPEDRAKVLAERWGRWDRDLMERGRQMIQLRRQFSQILVGAGTEDEKCARLKPVVAQFLELRRQQEEAKHNFETDILKSLTPAQQARMILLVEDIQTRIRDTLRDARRNGGHF